MRLKTQHIVLASCSPRRTELLTQMGITHSCVSICVPEIFSEHESCDDYVTRLAREKSQAGLDCQSEDVSLVIGADTVILFDQQILEKPKDEQDAFRMLSVLSEKTHLVKTAVTIQSREEVRTIVQTSEVTMGSISDREKYDYWRSGEPCDKAGGYAIQGKGAIFIKHIKGSYSGIMGLPVYETGQLLNYFGVKANIGFSR